MVMPSELCEYILTVDLSDGDAWWVMGLADVPGSSLARQCVQSTREEEWSHHQHCQYLPRHSQGTRKGFDCVIIMWHVTCALSGLLRPEPSGSCVPRERRTWLGYRSLYYITNKLETWKVWTWTQQNRAEQNRTGVCGLDCELFPCGQSKAEYSSEKLLESGAGHLQ